MHTFAWSSMLFAGVMDANGLKPMQTTQSYMSQDPLTNKTIVFATTMVCTG